MSVHESDDEEEENIKSPLRRYESMEAGIDLGKTMD
jgi:hypothetical protein